MIPNKRTWFHQTTATGHPFAAPSTSTANATDTVTLLLLWLVLLTLDCNWLLSAAVDGSKRTTTKCSIMGSNWLWRVEISRSLDLWLDFSLFHQKCKKKHLASANHTSFPKLIKKWKWLLPPRWFRQPSKFMLARK